MDDQYQSKFQKRRMLCAATVQTRVITIHIPYSSREIQPINDPISFPPINPSMVITPLHDALILTLCINDFDLHRVLVDPSSAADQLQLPASRQMSISLNWLSLASRILSGFNKATIVTMGNISLPVKVRSIVQQVLFSVVEDLGRTMPLLAKPGCMR